MHWTKGRPTKPGFYFTRFRGVLTGKIGETVVKVYSIPPGAKAADRIYWDGETVELDDDRLLKFAGPIPMPDESSETTREPRSCYDCVHCIPVKKDDCSGGRVGQHHCSAPCPMWVHGCANDEVSIIEDSGHDATMAKDCSLFMRK